MATLYSRRVLTPEGLRPAAVVLDGSRIAAVLDAPSGPAQDLGDAVLMPGLIDSHVHVNEPGRTAWEGFETATQAAAAGGVTTMVDMPLNASPVTTSLDALHQKLAVAADKLWVDCGFWGGVVPGNAPELAAMAAAGVMGFKCFLCHSGIDDFPNVTRSDLTAAMPILRDAGVPLLVHAELEQPIAEALTDADPRAYLSYLHSRPRAFEDAAVAMVIALVEETGCPAHIVHLSSATALPLIAAAKARGLPLTVETCPHYLCLTAEEIPDGATQFKCAPPIRPSENREALWRGLLDGTIDLVVSDHSPCIPGLKLLDTGDFLSAWGGIASLQLGLSSIWTEASRRGATIAQVSRWMTTAPAALLGLTDRGAISPGMRADLVAWQPQTPITITAEQILHRHKLTPYLGHTQQGVVTDTWVGGSAVVAAGQLQEPAGHILRRTP
ncbi:MAG: allantoinase AllB [Myxococcota bacterium]|nr:allantoinase AllB [Myxococcota bacterium]